MRRSICWRAWFAGWSQCSDCIPQLWIWVQMHWSKCVPPRRNCCRPRERREKDEGARVRRSIKGGEANSMFKNKTLTWNWLLVICYLWLRLWPTLWDSLLGTWDLELITCDCYWVLRLWPIPTRLWSRDLDALAWFRFGSVRFPSLVSRLLQVLIIKFNVLNLIWVY